jgi:hypothetical protein
MSDQVKSFEVEMKTKKGFVFTYMPLIKIKATDKWEAENYFYFYGKHKETIEELEADRDYWKSKCLLLQRM